jgi:hypothetical protein
MISNALRVTQVAASEIDNPGVTKNLAGRVRIAKQAASVRRKEPSL